MLKRALTILGTLVALSVPGWSSTVSIDLSGAVTGTVVSGVGASFAETFAGQTIVGGTGISGSPTNALTLLGSGTLDVAFFGSSNSILPEPGNQGPLSILLGSNANSFTWTMGFGNPPSSISVSLFAANGSLVNSSVLSILDGYNVYTLSGLGTFRGLTFFNNNDPAGVRFTEMSYNSVTSSVPEPATVGTLIGGLILLVGLARRRSKLGLA